MSTSSSLYISSVTWQRDSHELFDYESRQVLCSTVGIQATSRLHRLGGGIFSLPFDKNEPTAGSIVDESQLTAENLMDIETLGDSRFLVSPGSKKLWDVVSETTAKKHFLAEGDVVKLGRFKLRVKHLCTERSEKPITPEILFDQTATTAKICSDPHKICRICLMENEIGSVEDAVDPLIEACDCRGSIQYVHLGCLRFWIQGRLQVSDHPDSDSHTYLFSQLCCELCKAQYPLQVDFPTGRVALVPLPETRAPFLVLENMMRTEISPETRGVYVISLAGKKHLRLGRGHESDVRIADVSISRWHATVSFNDEGRFVIEDHNSKFGTLVAVRKPRMIDLNQVIPGDRIATLQSGRTVFRFYDRFVDESSRFLMDQSTPSATAALNTAAN
jgi:RING-variant domain/FHA domain